MSADVQTAPVRESSRVSDWGSKATAFILGPTPIAIVLALIVGGIFIAIGGANPLQAYGVMVEGSLTGTGLVNTLQRAVPLIGMALAVAVAFRAGVFNLGSRADAVAVSHRYVASGAARENRGEKRSGRAKSVTGKASRRNRASA